MFLNIYIYSGMSSRDINKLKTNLDTYRTPAYSFMQLLSSLKDWLGQRDEIGTQ